MRKLLFIALVSSCFAADARDYYYYATVPSSIPFDGTNYVGNGVVYPRIYGTNGTQRLIARNTEYVEQAAEGPFWSETDSEIDLRFIVRLVPVKTPDWNVSTHKDLNATVVFHYRWRYLDNKIGEWQYAMFNTANSYRSYDTIPIPTDNAGNIEYWLELLPNFPEYNFVDYAGPTVRCTSCFLETTYAVTNDTRKLGLAFPSMGEYPSVHLRKGKSDVDKVLIAPTNLYDASFAIDMTATNGYYTHTFPTNGVWRK